MQTVAGGRGITPWSCHGPVAVRGHREPSVGLSRSFPLIAVPLVSVCWGRGCTSPQGSLGTQKSQGCCARSGAGQLQEETGHPQACGIVLWACKQSIYLLLSQEPREPLPRLPVLTSANHGTEWVLAPAAPRGPALLLFVNEEGAFFGKRACLQDLQTLYFMTFFICIMKALIPSVINHIKNCFLE